METDEENEESESEDSGLDEDTPQPESREAEIESAPPPLNEEEVMDTSPDIPPAQTTASHERIPQATSDPPSLPSTNESGALQVNQINVGTPPAIPESSELPPPPPEEDLVPRESRQARRQADRDLYRMRLSRNRSEGGGGNGERDDDSDTSSDDEEHPYWVNLKEDTSFPDEQELKTIEENNNETSAIDHEPWENLIYQQLEDPEHIPIEAGRISWTVNGVRGTVEKPNKETMMRSPSMFIGGYYWNIKFFPRGNDGTEQLSIYIECSPTRYEEAEAKVEETQPPSAAVDARVEATSSGEGASHDSMDNVVDASGSSAIASANSAVEGNPKTASKEASKEQAPWGIAAQIGCVIYNPDEPRVHASQAGCHRYYNHNPDWGWTRFHGPWDEIHKRQRLQRQALLRNDTLAFTAYIRIIKDDTKALWWHPAKDKPEWDSIAMTGLKGFECLEYQSSAMIAALSSWMHLKPIERLICEMKIPDPVWDASKRMRPAFEELQELYVEGSTFVPSDEHDVSLSGLASILTFYGADLDSKWDVVSVWEHLRRILNFEASGLDSVEKGNTPEYDLFKDILVLKQPDLLDKADCDTKYTPAISDVNGIPEDDEPHSVQETINKANSDAKSNLRIWQSFEGQQQSVSPCPAVLQIELHRQNYVNEERKWKKLTHQIRLDENVSWNGAQYTLYGMIIHSGDLHSHEYSSVIRPEGPGTRWIEYAGDTNERKVSILTSRQATVRHQGHDKANGNAAVAYIVLYVRSDALPEVLCTPFKQISRAETQSHDTEETNATSNDQEMIDSKDIDQDIPVLIYRSDQFEGYSGRGLCDPWDSEKHDKAMTEFSLPASTPVKGLKEHLANNVISIENPEISEIRLWPMNTYLNTYISDQGVRSFPSLLSYKAHEEETLDEMCQHSGGCRFWMTLANKAPTPPTSTTPSAPVPETDRSQEIAARDEALHAVMMSIQAAEDHSIHNTSSSRDGWVEVADTDMAGNNADSSEETERQRQERRQQQHILIRMQQAQQLAQQIAQQRQQESESTAQQQAKETYFLVKVYDAEARSLRGVGSAVVKSESKIVEAVKKIVGAANGESWDCYLEHGIDMNPKDQVRSHETFEKRCGGADGCIFIAQRRLSAAEYVILESYHD